jgi:hypothetical protein
MRIEELVVQLSKDPFNPLLNYRCAQAYDLVGQTASAVSFYLRTAEYGYQSNPDYAYESLLKTSLCFEDQNDRQHTVSNCILQAITLLPEREEAYFLMARFHERSGNWQECYTWAIMGLKYSTDTKNDLLDYPGKVGLLFEVAVAGWWIGRAEESVIIFKELLTKEVPDNYRRSIEDNLRRTGASI